MYFWQTILVRVVQSAYQVSRETIHGKAFDLESFFHIDNVSDLEWKFRGFRKKILQGCQNPFILYRGTFWAVFPGRKTKFFFWTSSERFLDLSEKKPVSFSNMHFTCPEEQFVDFSSEEIVILHFVLDLLQKIRILREIFR